jgi:hypothetical protein
LLIVYLEGVDTRTALDFEDGIELFGSQADVFCEFVRRKVPKITFIVVHLMRGLGHSEKGCGVFSVVLVIFNEAVGKAFES